MMVGVVVVMMMMTMTTMAMTTTPCNAQRNDAMQRRNARNATQLNSTPEHAARLGILTQHNIPCGRLFFSAADNGAAAEVWALSLVLALDPIVCLVAFVFLL